MRDDIHRRLPLPRAWKTAVRACVRDAEAPLRASLVEQAAMSELRELRPAVLDDALRMLSTRQVSLFPGESVAPTVMPLSPLDHALQREALAFVEMGLPAEDALARALDCALRQRVGAVIREIRAQLNLERPHDCAELVVRFLTAAQRADLRRLAQGHVAGERMQPLRRLPLDLDSDLRSAP